MDPTLAPAHIGPDALPQAPAPAHLNPDDLPQVQNLTAFVTCGTVFTHGGRSDVYRGTLLQDGNAQQVAVKVFRFVPEDDPAKSIEENNRRLSREARLWRILEHPNLLPLLGLCEVPDRPLGLVSPYCTQKTVTRFLRQHEVRESVIPGLLIGIARGLNYLHERHVVHGDIKPNNVLVDGQENARICDFGVSKLLGQTGFTTVASKTVRYMAPELEGYVQGYESDEDARCDEASNKMLAYPCDIYGLAMTILEMVSLKQPFHHLKSDYRVVKQVCDGERPCFSKHQSASLTPSIQTLITDCWNQDPARRPRINKVLNRLLEMFPTVPSQIPPSD